MPNIALKDILISARQESYQMRHFYVGAEHLFIALLDIKGSLTGSIIQECGLTPEYVIDAIRRKVGKGSKHRLWAGVPNTPRANVLLGIANDLALENDRKEINERDLLVAIFEEKASIPIRVLKVLGIKDIDKLAEMARTFVLNSDSQQIYVKVDFGPEFDREHQLPKDQLFILRRMFHGYNQIRIERQLTGGYTNATLLIVTPILVDEREDAAIVAKISTAADILDEAQRYESHVKSKLPAMTARLEDKPVAPETSDLAGLKYTLVAEYDGIPHDLRTILKTWAPGRLGDWLKDKLFTTFGQWWQQNKLFRFQAWREYDWMLPPILTLEIVKSKQPPSSIHTIRMPVKRARLRRLEYNEIVTVENFIVQKVSPEKNMIQLAAGHGTDSAKAFKIEVRGVDLTKNTHYRGEVIDSIVGRVWKTRNEQLVQAVRELEPDFDPGDLRIPSGGDNPDSLPNPIIAHEELLDNHVNGSLSTIHGDLHPGNIMIGPNQSAFLIDFAHTREGHTFLDWATLEVSLLSDTIMSKNGESWEDVRRVLQQVIHLNGCPPMMDTDKTADSSLAAIVKIREIAKECLISEDQWSEYFVALAFCSLRAVTWKTIPLAGRRLMFLVSALAIHELRGRFRHNSESGSPSPDETDINTI
jgi:hypothetical protein